MNSKLTIAVLLFISFISCTFALGTPDSEIALVGNGFNISAGNVTAWVSTNSSCAGDVYKRSFTDALANNSFSLNLGAEGDLQLTFNKKYYFNYSLNGVSQSFRNNTGSVVQCQEFVSPMGIVDWDHLFNFPTACGAGEAVTDLSTGACAPFGSGNGSGNISGYGSATEWAFFISSGVITSATITFANISGTISDAQMANQKLNVSDQRYNETLLVSDVNSSLSANISSLNASLISLAANISSLNSSIGTGSSASSFGTYFNITTTTYNGSFVNGSLLGYVAANAICNQTFTGSHFCTTQELINMVRISDTTSWTGNGWISNGPPGYTANANDCKGWTNSTTTYLGPYWILDANGGQGYLTACAGTRSLICCT